MAISHEAIGFMQVAVAGDRGICGLPRNPTRVFQFTHQGFVPVRSLGARGAVFSTRVFQFTHQGFVPARFSAARSAVFAVGGEGAESPAVLPSGEWPENFSILNFEDLSKHYESVLFKEEAQPSTFLADVMSKTIYTARAEQSLEEIDHCFIQFSGLPVINDKLECIGVLSKKDRVKASNGLNSKVQEVMSSPAITLSADKTVSDAAVLMLKHKIHRIPIVNGSRQVVGTKQCGKSGAFRAAQPRHSLRCRADAEPQQRSKSEKITLPDFFDVDRDATAFNLIFESTQALETARHYEIVFLVHEDHVEEVQDVIQKVKDFIEEKKGKIFRLNDWGMRKLAYKIKKAKRANYVLMNIQIGGQEINDFKSLLDKDERVIRHLVMTMKQAETKETVPPPEFSSIRDEADLDEYDSEEEYEETDDEAEEVEETEEEVMTIV